MWMTNASISRPDGRPSAGRAAKAAMPSAILVPTSLRLALSFGPPERRWGCTVRLPRRHLRRGSRPARKFAGCRGAGLQQTMSTLDSGPSASGVGLGLAQAAYEEALKYSKQRRGLWAAIANFQAIQWMLADAATEIEAARLMVLKRPG